MSNAVLNLVFDHSRSRGIDRLVLLSIADRSDDDGNAWCGTADISKRAGIERQHVTRHTNKLSLLGELEIGFREGPNKANRYRISICPTVGQSQGGTVPPRGAGCPKVVQNMSHSGTQTPRTHLTPKIDISSDPDFSVFWNAYPRKISKPTAFRAWKNAKSLPPISELLAAIERQKASEQWQTPKFIPYPATWINGSRWDDELTPAKQQTQSLNESKYDW